MATCLLGLGSNLGDRADNLRQAIHLLSESARVLAQSGLHSTRPVGGPAGQPDFLNAAVLLETELQPLQLLAELQHIEQQLGRRRTETWGPRSLDLDMLLYDQYIVESPALVIPHPRLAYRRFVLAPAVEIAGQMLHASTQFSLSELLDRLDRQPIHVAIVGEQSSVIALAASNQIQSVLLRLPASRLVDSSSAAETLEFLREGAGRWSAACSQSAAVVISEFWIGEVWSDLDEQPVASVLSECQAVWNTLPPQLAEPHLLIWLEPVNKTLPDRWDRLRRLVFRPRQFPVLTLRNVGTETAIAEISAAVEAMRP